MSFAFGFSGDDIESDGEGGNDAPQAVDQIDDDAPGLTPRVHKLQELFASLPSQISCNVLSIAAQPGDHGTSGSNLDTLDVAILIPRRSVFDIRAQLMAEANPDENENDSILTGLENGDLTSGVYEGGFKTWECSLDLASLLAAYSIDQDLHVIELGAGSAVPSLVLMQQALRRDLAQSKNIAFTLCDYNEDVLRLATAPNIFLTGELAIQQSAMLVDGDGMEVEDLDEKRTNAVVQRLQSHNLSFNFISGGWGEQFLHHLHSISEQYSGPGQTTLILASETIYSPRSTRIFVRTLMRLLCRDPANSKALVAAKKVYFGVGGGVDDFVAQLAEEGGSVRQLLDVKGFGVGRVVLEITAESR